MLLVVIAGGVTAYYYSVYAAIIDERLHGERERTLPRVFGRPLEIRRGQALSAQELVALGKSKPGELTFASTGIGTPGHLNGELFSRLAGIKAGTGKITVGALTTHAEIERSPLIARKLPPRTR